LSAQKAHANGRVEPMMEAAAESSRSPSSLATYLAEINKYSLLSVDEEQKLARRFRKYDLRAGHRLVTSNLRFVVKVAYEYRSYGIKMPDLIQEGNIGLMKAVQKFDPDKEIRLISYAVWWIRAYIQNYILKSWSLVKLGTTQAQRKLFFSLARTRRELEKYNHGEPTLMDVEEIAKRLRVKPGEVREMEQRMGGRDLSLDAPMGEDGSNSHVDLVVSTAAGQDEEFADKEQAGILNARVQVALRRLDPRERFIIQQRVMNERPMTLKELGEHFGFSRERARQLEIRAKDKLRDELAELVAEVQPESLCA
jgi:RNA polymerase sigma-32 factor